MAAELKCLLVKTKWQETTARSVGKRVLVNRRDRGVRLFAGLSLYPFPISTGKGVRLVHVVSFLS